MAQITDAEFDHQLQQTLTDGLRDAGLNVSVHIQPISDTKLHRVFVVSQQRDQMQPSEWYNVLWRIIHRQLGEEADLRITSIFTLTPQEWQDYQEEDDE